MKKKSVLAFMMAFAMVAGMAAAPAITTQAAGLTQADSPDQVAYGVVSTDDVEILKSLFDLDYYYLQNPDLSKLYGKDYDKLFEHFCTLGIFEGRVCNPNFDPSAYSSAYSDLKELFGKDIVKYYTHYAKFAEAENRNITTLEAAARAGIVVTPILNENAKITPEIYRIAKSVGATSINSIVSIANSFYEADKRGAAVVIAPKSDETYLKARGLQHVATISLGEGKTGNEVCIALYKGKTGYAAFETPGYYWDLDGESISPQEYLDASEMVAITVDSIPVYVTADYTQYESEEEFYNDYKDTVPADLLATKVNLVGYNIGRVGVVVGEKDSFGRPETSKENDPHYDIKNETMAYPQSGLRTYVSSFFSGFGGTADVKEEINVVEKESNKMYEGDYVLDGVYTDSEGNWKEFASYEEKHDYLDSTTYTEYKDGGTTTVYHYHPEERHVSESIDEKGTKETVYDVGMEITTKENGDAQFTVSITNPESEYANIATLEFSREVITR